MFDALASSMKLMWTVREQALLHSTNLPSEINALCEDFGVDRRHRLLASKMFRLLKSVWLAQLSTSTILFVLPDVASDGRSVASYRGGTDFAGARVAASCVFCAHFRLISCATLRRHQRARARARV